MSTVKLPYFERLMIFVSMFSFGLLFYRCLFTLSIDYTFFLWNLLIAFIPYLISKQLLKYKTFNIKAFSLLLLWLMFFPGCIYLFTDFLHMHKTNFPLVYDVSLFLSFAVASLLPGLMSLKQIEIFLNRHTSAFRTRVTILLFIFLSSYNIVLARFLHLRSWNIITDFRQMLYASKKEILFPESSLHIWLAILMLVLLIDLAYTGFKKLYQLEKVKYF